MVCRYYLRTINNESPGPYSSEGGSVNITGG